MDPDPSPALKELIKIALEECNDSDTLELVYALLVYEN
jgi:hypothetical protein